MLSFHQTTRFKKNMQRTLSQGKDYNKFRVVFLALLKQEPLDQKYRDHPLVGDWIGSRELHIEPNWLLIYRIEENTLVLERTGSHSELFE